MVTSVMTIDCTCIYEDAPSGMSGLIIVNFYGSDEYCIHEDSALPSLCFANRKDGVVTYGGYTWLRTTKSLLGTAHHHLGTSRSDLRCDIMEFDSLGSPKRLIYQAEDREIAWPEFASWDDRFLLFTTHHLLDPSKHPFEALTPMLTLKVMDMKSGEVLQVIDSIGRPPSYQMCESPWFHDGQRFVWSVSRAPKLIDDDGDIFPHDASGNGVYVFDMRTRTSSLILPGAEQASVSPTRDILAFLKGKELRVLDLDGSIDRLLFTFTDVEDVRTIHWSPDGKAVFVGSVEQRRTKERLIDIETGEEMPFNGIGLTNANYSWK